MKKIKLDTRIFSIGALGVAFASTLCCVVPLILFLLGIGGAKAAIYTQSHFIAEEDIASQVERRIYPRFSRAAYALCCCCSLPR